MCVVVSRRRHALAIILPPERRQVYSALPLSMLPQQRGENAPAFIPLPACGSFTDLLLT